MNKGKFMINKILGTIGLIVFGTSLCMAQSIDQSDNNNWGKSVQGVQLSITLTNSDVIVAAGSSITFVAVIKNISTNTIDIGYTALPSDYDAVLTSATGKIYHLIDSPLILRMNLTLPVNPGEQNVRLISATIRKDIEPGDYTLKAVRRFYVNKHWLKVESNLLKVQVK